MKKYYEGPEIIVRNYALIPSNIVMTSTGTPSDGSDPNLGDGDDYFD